MAQGRSLLKEAFKNFLNSLKPKKYWGELKGKDYLGTEYYEAPEGLQNLRKPSRWFVPTDRENFQQEIPPEWESWLRHRRKDPPTEEEINLNIQKMLERVENSKKFDKPKTANIDEIKVYQKPGFPINEKYELKSRTNEKKKNEQ